MIIDEWGTRVSDGFGRDRSCFSFGWRDCTWRAGCSAGKDRGLSVICIC